ncbi:MAG: hypothetical protein ACODAQ_01340 [Phycisphaeraceae bacterium]
MLYANDPVKAKWKEALNEAAERTKAKRAQEWRNKADEVAAAMRRHLKPSLPALDVPGGEGAG